MVSLIIYFIHSTHRAKELMLLNCGIGEDSWASLGQQGDQTSSSQRKSTLNVLWKDWCSNTLATWCKKPTLGQKTSCWERLKAGRQRDDREWDDSIASSTQWTWVWVNSRSWWWTGRPGVLQSMGSQSRIQLSDWTKLNWYPITSDFKEKIQEQS